MRTTAGAGAACSPGCSAEDGDLHCPAGLGYGPGPGAGGMRRGAVRPVSGGARPRPAAAAGRGAGSAVLDGCHRGAVPLVPGGLGGLDPALRRRGPLRRRGDLLPGVQPLDAEAGLFCRRCGRSFAASAAAPPGGGRTAAKKISKTCEKHLPLWAQMV